MGFVLYTYHVDVTFYGSKFVEYGTIEVRAYTYQEAQQEAVKIAKFNCSHGEPFDSDAYDGRRYHAESLRMVA